MINKDTYKRFTELKTYNNGKKMYVQYSVIGCYNDMNRKGDYTTGDSVDRLAELEDKIENGTLLEVLKVGDTATAIIDTLAYDNSLQKVKIEGLAYIVKDENGDMTFQHISRIFPNEKEAEAKLKELQADKQEVEE